MQGSWYHGRVEASGGATKWSMKDLRVVLPSCRRSGLKDQSRPSLGEKPSVDWKSKGEEERGGKRRVLGVSDREKSGEE